MTPMTQDRTLTAAAMVMVYAMVIGFTDNFVRVIAAEGGLWQFHATRSVMAWGILLVLGGVGLDAAFYPQYVVEFAVVRVVVVVAEVMSHDRRHRWW